MAGQQVTPPRFQMLLQQPENQKLLICMIGAEMSC
jgi:hypothetical protein